MVSFLVSLVSLPAQAAGRSPDDATVLAALCPRGHRCRVESRTSAGRDADGLDLVVTRVKVLDQAVGDRPADHPEGPCLLEPVGVFRLRNGVVVSHEPIMTLYQQSKCWYGPGPGDEELTVEKGRAVFDIDGGTSWRWSDHNVWALSPRVTLVSTEHEEWHNFSVIHSVVRTDRLSDRSEVIWRSPVCGREPEEVGGGGAVEGDPSVYRYLVIPRSRRSAAATGDGWRQDRDDLRWVDVDSSGASGYVVHGKRGEAGDARLRVTAPDRRLLLVDVADDRVVPVADSWVHADHLELWGTPDAPGPLAHCLERRRPPPDDADEAPVGPAWQWGVMLDGAIHPGAGHPPAAPIVEVAELDTRSWGKVRRFRIELPKTVDAVTVVYSDSDDGLTQKRLIGTSRLRFGDAASLGAIEREPKR
jgi:hypothetical protein